MISVFIRRRSDKAKLEHTTKIDKFLCELRISHYVHYCLTTKQCYKSELIEIEKMHVALHKLYKISFVLFYFGGGWLATVLFAKVLATSNHAKNLPK